MENSHLTPSKIPPDFVQWAERKKVSPRDLAPLLAVTDHHQLAPILIFLANSSATKSQGVQALEIAVDLFLNGALSLDIPGDTKFDDWFNQIKAQRYPQRYAAIAELERQLKALPWPKGTDFNIIENADRLSFSVRMNVFDGDDFVSKANDVRACAEQLKKSNNE